MSRSGIAGLALVAIGGSLLFSQAGAQTTIPGGNVVNQTWTPAGSPYNVQGDVTVPSGSFLLIEAGTTVQFATSDSQAAGLDTARAEMTVQGTLTISGTSGSPVVLRSQGSGVANAWYGVVIGSSATSASIAGAQIRHANQAIRNSAAGTVLQVTSTTIDTSNAGAYVLAGSPSFTDVTSSGNVYGFYYSGNAGGALTRCIARSNSSHGIYFSATSGSPVLNVVNGTLHGNSGDGLHVAAGSVASASVTVRNSILTQNNYGIRRAGSSAVTATHNDVWNNLSANYSNVSAGAGSISANPLYVSSPTNLRLTSNSPARFAGDLGGDLGALPYASDPTPGNYGTLWANATFTAAGSPYVLAGDLTIAPGVTLTVEPGATVQAATSDLMGAGANVSRVELRVGGTLLAQGTFTSAGSSASSWYGIAFLPGSSGSSVTNATVDEAIYGLHLDAVAPPAVTDVTVSGCQYGVYVQSGSPTLTRVAAVGHTGNGFHFTGSAGGTLSGCVARSNATHGVLFSPTSGAPALQVLQSTLHGNGGDGVQAAGSVAAASVVVKNSIVTQNNRGVYRSGSPSVTATYNDVWSNLTNYDSVSGGPGSISVNPLYASAPTNLRLTSNSPARFAGDLGGDLGALPYGSDPTPGNYGTLWSDATLSAAGSPHSLGGDFTVASGVTLTIEAGATVQAATSDLMASGLDTGRVELRVAGRLLAQGTAGSPLHFGSAGSWYGLVFAEGSTGSILEHATIEAAIRGITHDTTGACTYSDLVVRNCTTGVVVQRGSPTFGAVAAHSNTEGFSFIGSAGGTIVNGVVRGNATTGIAFRPDSGTPSLAVESCTVDANGTYGILGGASGSVATLTVRNSNLTSSAYGIYRGGTETVAATYNNAWNNAAANYANLSPGTGSISVDPAYAGPPTDLRLGAGSPLIDAATAPGAPGRDHDGAWRPVDGNADGNVLPDIGAFEYAVFPATPGAVAETTGGPNAPLSVSKVAGRLSFTWGATCGNSATDYALYEGRLGSWYDHVPATCSTGGQRDWTLSMPEEDRYYLVVPRSTTEEGGYGRDSTGNPIPVGTPACTATQNLGGCF